VKTTLQANSDRVAAPCRRVTPHLIRCAFLLGQLITVTGTIRQFQWSNPHVILWLVNGPDANGAAELWTLELPTSPGVLTRMGWDKHSLKPGDRVVVEFNPLRNGEHGGSFKKATLVESGKVLEVNIGPPATTPDPKQP
jgi:hypothetical protein